VIRAKRAGASRWQSGGEIQEGLGYRHAAWWLPLHAFWQGAGEILPLQSASAPFQNR
jgi:hypothetical protein